MKRFIIVIIALLLLSLGGFYLSHYYDKKRIELIQKEEDKKEAERIKILMEERQRLEAHIEEARQFVSEHHYDDEHVILIDFKIHSGKPRFFVWNLKDNRLEFSSLVAHGYGNKEFRSSTSEITFSNIPNSYASSLGKYRLGERSYSQYGIHIHYKMHGLEESNSNAFNRYIVLHSYDKFPKREIYPFHLPLGFSQGCPVIDDESMRKIDQLLQTKKNPVLLWIYY